MLISCLTFTGLQIGTETHPQNVKIFCLDAFSVSRVLTASMCCAFLVGVIIWFSSDAWAL